MANKFPFKVPKPSSKARGEGPLEAKVEKDVCDYAKDKYGVIPRKFTSPSHRSVPDRLLLWPGGHILFIEFKRRHKTPTEAQWREINRLYKQGFAVEVVDCRIAGRKLIDAYAERFRTTTD